MGYAKIDNSAETLSLFGGSYDPHRNVRDAGYSRVAPGFMRVMGVLRDDSNISADRPRYRVHSLRFDVLVPEKVSREDCKWSFGNRRSTSRKD
jgi:hypothetical protein